MAVVHCPEQEHNSVHDKSFCLHLHRPLHVFLQPHFISSLQAVDASGRSLHNGTTLSPNFLQPHSSGSKCERCFTRPFDQYVACREA